MKLAILITLLLTSLSFLSTAQVLTEVDEIAPFQEGLAGVKKGNSWGFVNDTGTLTIAYRKDIVVSPNGAPVFSEGYCLVQEVRDGITFYGYINTKGEKVIPAD